MIKNLFIVVIIIYISSCVTTKEFKDNNYYDSEYPLKVKFPENFEIRTDIAKSDVRVFAMEKGHGKFRRFKAPTFEIKVIPIEKDFEQFIEDSESKLHFEPGYWQYEKTHEFNVKTKKHNTKLVYFDSKSKPMSIDSFHLHAAKNHGINAYIDLDDYYIVILYISNYRWYNEKHFNSVMRSLDFLKVEKDSADQSKLN